MLAVHDRVTRFDLLPSFMAQSQQLRSALQGAFETNLTLGEIVDLAVIASHVHADHITTAAVSETCTQPWITPGEAHVLIHIQDAIDALVTNLFAPPPATAVPR